MFKIFATVFLLVGVGNDINAITNVDYYQPLIPKTCTTTRVFEPSLSEAFKRNDRRLTEIIFEILNARHNNVGVTTINFPSGSKSVYRSAVLMTAIPCLEDLIKQCGVKHIVDISNPRSYNVEPWIAKEKEYFFYMVADAQKSNYIRINDLDYNYKKISEKNLAFGKIAEIINIIAKLNGTVLVHCLGGEHKTGIVFAVMQKCFNELPLSYIEDEYKQHAAWESEQKPGGFKPENMELIEDFPCDMLGLTSTSNEETTKDL